MSSSDNETTTTPATPEATPAPKPATKSARKSAPAVSVKTIPAKKKAKPAKPVKPAAATEPAKEKKPKLVRDSFTMPKLEFAVIDTMKLRAAKLAVPVKN